MKLKLAIEQLHKYMKVSNIKNWSGHRILWIDLAKVITMLLVVIGHANFYKLTTNYGGIDPFRSFENYQKSISYTIFNFIVGYIYTFHMPLFMALSGMTFFLSDRSQSLTNELIKKKAKRLMAPFFLITLFFLVPVKYICGYWDNSIDIYYDIFVGQFLLFGGSHLWFIVSLFIITICFALLNKRIKIQGGWILLAVVSYIGLIIERYGCFLGIPGALKYFFFFALGYYSFDRIRSSNKRFNPLLILLSWVSMVVVYLLTLKINGHIRTLLTFIPMAIWGIINMIASCKAIIRCFNFMNYGFLRSLNKNSYDLYLYSEPFNYIIICIVAMLIGPAVYSSEKFSILAFIIRIIMSICGSYVIIWCINYIHKIIDRHQK